MTTSRMTPDELAQPLEQFESTRFIPYAPAQARYLDLVHKRMSAQIAMTVQRDELLHLLRMRIEGRTQGGACPLERRQFEAAHQAAPEPCWCEGRR